MLSHRIAPSQTTAITAQTTRETSYWPDCLTSLSDGRFCIGQGNKIIISDAKTEKTLIASSSIHGLSAFANGKLASAHRNSNTILLWDLTAAKAQTTINVMFPPECLTANQDYLISGHSLNSGVGNISFWKIDSCLVAASQHEIESPVFALCAFPDNRRIASGHTDGTICLWNIEDIENPIQLNKFKNVMGNQINSLGPIVTDEDHLAVSDLDGNIALLNLMDGKKQLIGSLAPLYTYITLLPTQQLGFVSKDQIGTYDLTVITEHLKTRKALEKDILPVYFAPGVDHMVLDYYAPNFFKTRKSLEKKIPPHLACNKPM